MKALFWDFDGTLVDSRLKNYQVTKKIIRDMTTKDPINISFLKSFENYKQGMAHFRNWRDIYKRGIGLNDDETDQIGRVWTEYQLNDKTPTPLFKGIREVITTFGDSPNVIISQNSKKNIFQVLNEFRIASFFKLIIGFEEIDIRKQKPDPISFLNCIEDLSLNKYDYIYYIGDHETDILFAKNTSDAIKFMSSNITIVSIGAFYGNDQSVSDWNIQPDYVANIPHDIIQIINGA